MDCHSNHSVFLRADGSLACWDDAGSRLKLQTFNADVDVSRDVVFGKVFAGIRSSLAAGEMPFPGQCQDCMVLASGACFNPAWVEKKEIVIFQVEPSIACTMECPGCMTLKERKRRHGPPWNLDIDMFEKYLSDFRDDGVTIRTIDFQGHGEPLINRDVWKMAGLAKSYFPDANITMCTNAHGRYDPSHVHSGIDEVMFAIDGVDQPSYEQNRVRGSFDKAYAYMSEFCHGAAREERKVRTIWKYILFDCNDSPEQLIRAQELAAEAGVDEILFVNTQLGLRASGVLDFDQIPRADAGVPIRISNYLSNFHDMLHSVDKARIALFQGQAETAGAHLGFAANMIRRRFECIGPADAVPDGFQALIHELLDLAEDDRLSARTRDRVAGGLHALRDKLVIDRGNAKRQVIAWKREEIGRLAAQVDGGRHRGPRATARRVIGAGLTTLDVRFGLGGRRARNLVIHWQAQEVMQLAVRLDQTAGPGVSVM